MKNKGNISLKSPFNGNKSLGAKSPAKGTPVKQNPKKTGKTPVKVVPPKEVEDEEEESDEEDSGADVDVGVADEADSSVEDAEEGDSDDDDEDEDEDDEEKDDDEDDENEELDNESVEDNAQESADNDEDIDMDDGEPIEVPIVKKGIEVSAKPKKGKKAKEIEPVVSKIKTGALPKDFPKNQVLVVKNLPKSYKQKDLLEVFAKFGDLHTIYNNHGPVGSVAYVAYTSAEEAEAAQLATNRVAKVKGAVLSVSLQLPNSKKNKKAENKQNSAEDKKRKIEESKNRTVYIKNLNKTTNEKEVKEHFSACGNIESMRLFSRPQHSYGFISFKEESSVDAALNLHNSVLDRKNMWVVKAYEDHKESAKDSQHTVLVKNNQNLECIEPEKLDSIFSKCGEIENISILCSKNVLAFVTFKEPKGAKKALKLNGSSLQGLEIEVEEYKLIAQENKTTVFIQNVKTGVTEEDIRELFASTGPIESVNVFSGFAIVKFEDIDGFCKSFILNESILRGNVIFIEPYSTKKKVILKKNQKPLNRKRPAPPQQGGSVKKIKTN